MVLIKCPECNMDVSDKAGSCPKCGCPISTDVSDVSQEVSVSERVQTIEQTAKSLKAEYAIAAATTATITMLLFWGGVLFSQAWMIIFSLMVLGIGAVWMSIIKGVIWWRHG